MTSHRLSFCYGLIVALLLQGLIHRYGPALFRLAMQHHRNGAPWLLSPMNAIDDLKIDKRHLLHDTDVAQMAWDLLGIYLSHHVSSHSLRDPQADRKAQFSVKRIVASIEAIREGPVHQGQEGQ